MPIQGITDGAGPVVGQPDRNTGEISKLDFMSLLVAQIQNQDPTSPMDNAEFTSQITEFTMLDELTAMNEKMDESIMVGQSVNNTAMLALVGKNVTVAGDTVNMVEGQASQNVINTTGPGMVSVDVRDQNGAVVDHYDIDVSGGLSDINWDGLDDDGEPFPDGQYTLDVSVTNSGIDVPHELLKTGAVDGLRYENGVAVVSVDDLEYYVSEIYKVS